MCQVGREILINQSINQDDHYSSDADYWMGIIISHECYSVEADLVNLHGRMSKPDERVDATWCTGHGEQQAD